MSESKRCKECGILDPEHLRIEIESLCRAIYNNHYKDIAPNFGLCDSLIGIMTQIDNMTAGMSEKIKQLEEENQKLKQDLSLSKCLTDELKEENQKLKERLEPIQSVYDCYKELYNGKNTFFSGNRNGRN